MRVLGAFLNGELVAEVRQGDGGKVSLVYDGTWLARSDSYALSLSMPLARREHGDEVVRPFMEGLLPDNAAVLERWAREFQVSPRNPFALLEHVGQDCAGAVQFLGPERYGQASPAPEDEVAWLTEEDVGARLRDLVERRGTGRLAGDKGQFSLAGAQPKTALVFDGQRWGVPSGSTPTTYILKPPAQRDFDGFDVNEHLCLRLAEELGLSVPRSRLRRFDGQEALVLERYDRRRMPGGRFVRVHQEDACQALGISPLRKYENEGGPGAPEIVQLLVRESDDPTADVGAFVDALTLNWVIGGTDAHAKNYSLIISAGTVRLAPFYDLISVLPYPDQVAYRRARLAMRVDREYHLHKIGRRHWEGLAMRSDLDVAPVVERVAELVAAVPGALDRAVTTVRREGIEHNVIDRLVVAVREHSERCLRLLEGGE